DAQRLRLARNFGIESEEIVSGVGINGKMSEVNAAIGLLNLKGFEEERLVRSKLRATYDTLIGRFPGLIKQIKQLGVKQSEQYYVIVVDPDVFGATRDDIYTQLKAYQIFSRRYFWPICTDFECYRGYRIHSVHERPVVDRIKDKVLCLPFHSGVMPDHVERIEAVLEALAGNR
ncbi:MAG: DegT/DnrJ/EryC1/StrS family aminotransferase, partial [Halothiobacillus sp.]|nr:DegT/DnrJ/EryC1/StrS family aminotransferase [Halothiobacillus sp.]